MSKTKPNLAIVGCTGVVGREMLQILEERAFPLKEIRLVASGRSAGEKLPYSGRKVTVENLATADFTGIDLVLSSIGASVSRKFVPKAVEAGAVVVDNSSAFRMDSDVPLVVPEVNPGAIIGHKGIIANPNCSTIQMVVALWPLHLAFGLKRVVVSTYQAVSGAGLKAMEELSGQCMALLGQRPVEIDVFAHQIAFNVLPHIDVFEEDGYSSEETKMVRESQKIMDLPDLRLTATAVRVPVLNSHCEAINIETKRSVSVAKAREVFASAPGIEVVDDCAEQEYPTPLAASGRDEVLVGRIRCDTTVKNGLDLWICADNIRKGAALNTVQIAELLHAPV